MKRPRKWMSVEEHEALARRLWRAIAEMETVGAVLLETYGASSQLGGRGERFCVTAGRTGLEELRRVLSEQWYAEGHSTMYGVDSNNPYDGTRANHLKQEAKEALDASQVLTRDASSPYEPTAGAPHGSVQ